MKLDVNASYNYVEKRIEFKLIVIIGITMNMLSVEYSTRTLGNGWVILRKQCVDDFMYINRVQLKLRLINDKRS